MDAGMLTDEATLPRADLKPERFEHLGGHVFVVLVPVHPVPQRDRRQVVTGRKMEVFDNFLETTPGGNWGRNRRRVCEVGVAAPHRWCPHR